MKEKEKKRMEIFIAVLVVLIVLIYFMIVMLRSVASEAGHKVDEYFIKNLEEFDSDYQEKFKKMNAMHAEEEKLQRQIKTLKNEMISFKTSPFYAPRPLARDVFIPIARYIDNDFFESYKIAKDKLQSIDKQEVIDNVIKKVNYTGDPVIYKACCGINEKLNFNALYDLCGISGAEQLDVLEECFDENENALLSKFSSKLVERSDFEVLKFVDYIKRVKQQHDPHVFVYVGINEEDYSNPERLIVCSEDSNICEGIKIVYQHNVYDYSIYKSRRKVGS